MLSKKTRFVNVKENIFTYLCSFSKEYSGISMLIDNLLKREIYVQEGEHLVSNIYEKNTIVEWGDVNIIKIKKDVGFDDLEYLAEKRVKSILGGAFTKLVTNFFMSDLFKEIKMITPKITLKWWYLLLLSGFFNDENKFYANNYFFVPEPYNEQNTYKTSIFKIVANIVLKTIIDSQTSNEDELGFFNIEKKEKNENKRFIQFRLPTQIFLNDIDHVIGNDIANAERKNKVHYYSACLWNKQKWQFLNGNWSIIKDFTFNKTIQTIQREKIESILWDSPFEQFFYSHLVLRQREYGINTIVRNQRDCFLGGEAFGVAYLKCSYPFVDRFEPDFIIIGKKNGIPYQIICDTKGNLKSYLAETTYDDKAITKLVYSNKVYHKVLASYNKGITDSSFEVRTSITLIYQDYYKDQFYVVYYDKSKKKTQHLELNKYIDVLVGIKWGNQMLPHVPYEVIKVSKQTTTKKQKPSEKYSPSISETRW